MRTIINYRNDFENIRKDVVEDLDEIIEECDAKGDCGILSRTKTPYSIVNKLRRRSLTDVKDLDKLESKAKAKIKDKDLTGIDLYKGLTDVVGTMVVAPDKKNADKVKEAINSGRLGKVLEFEDFYAEPNNGYRAYHFLIAVEKDNKVFPIEVQVKTKRVKILGDFAHTLYKTGNLNGNAFNELNELALKGDMGDIEAQKEFDEIVSNQQKVISMISKKSMAKGGLTDKRRKAKDLLKKYQTFAKGGNLDLDEYYSKMVDKLGKEATFIRILKDSQFDKARIENEYRYSKNGKYMTASVSDEQVVFYGMVNETFTSPKKLAEYLDKNQIFAKGGYVVEDGKVMLDGNKIGSYQFDRDSDSFWIYDGVKDRNFEEKEDIIDYFENRNFAKGGEVDGDISAYKHLIEDIADEVKIFNP